MSKRRGCKAWFSISGPGVCELPWGHEGPHRDGDLEWSPRWYDDEDDEDDEDGRSVPGGVP